MADGTAGLGQGTTVFDFSGIGKLGLQIDEMQRQKEEKKSAKFQRSSEGAMDGVSISGVRENDKPYLNNKYNEWMETATQAMQTEDPALLAKANTLKSELSQRVSESQSYQKSWLTGMEKTVNSTSYKQQPSMYDDRMEWYKTNTAMTDENNGQVGDDGYFFHQELIDYAPKDIVSIAGDYVGAVKQAATETTSFSGPEGGSSKTVINEKAALESVDKQFEVFLQSENQQELLFENYMIKESGRSYFEPKDVKAFQDRLALGEQLKNKYTDLDALKQDMKDSPLQLAQAEKAWNMEAEMVAYGKDNFTKAIMANMDLGKKQSTTVKDPDAGAKDAQAESDKYGYSGGQKWSDIVGEDADLSKVGEVPEDFSIGKSSTKGGALRSFGKGKNATYYEGLSAMISPDFEVDEEGNVVDGEIRFLLNTRVPAESDLEQIIQAQKDGKTGAELLELVDFTLQPVSLGTMEGDIPKGELKMMKKLAIQEALKAQKEANEALK